MFIRTDEGTWINTDNIDFISPDGAFCKIYSITEDEGSIRTEETADHLAVRILSGQISNSHFPGMPQVTRIGKVGSPDA